MAVNTVTGRQAKPFRLDRLYSGFMIFSVACVDTAAHQEGGCCINFNLKVPATDRRHVPNAIIARKWLYVIISKDNQHPHTTPIHSLLQFFSVATLFFEGRHTLTESMCRNSKNKGETALYLAKY